LTRNNFIIGVSSIHAGNVALNFFLENYMVETKMDISQVTSRISSLVALRGTDIDKAAWRDVCVYIAEAQAALHNIASLTCDGCVHSRGNYCILGANSCIRAAEDFYTRQSK